MTWSILARDAQGHFGVAIASKFFAVGALCVHTQRDVGAIATQALLNPLYGPAGLALLAQGLSAAQVVATLTAADPGHGHRQLQVLPAEGAPAVHTGGNCVDWCGAQPHADFTVAGNMLAGPQVLAATSEAFVASAGLPLAERLLAALVAGEAAGGDKRGKQSAALCIHTNEDHRQLDLRVDDHDDPIPELQRLYHKAQERFLPFTGCLAGRHDPVGLTDRAQIEARVQAFHAARADR